MKLETTRLILGPFAVTENHEVIEYRFDKEPNKHRGWIPGTIDDGEIFTGR